MAGYLIVEPKGAPSAKAESEHHHEAD